MKIFSFIALLITSFTIFSNKALAHVRYIADDADVATHGGHDFAFFLEPLMQGSNITMIVITVVVLVILLFVLPRIGFLRRLFGNIAERASSYRDLVPWMLRLSLGIALIGAGTHGFLVSPVLPGFEALAGIQVLLGFFLLAGFLITPITLAVIGFYVVALTKDIYILGSLEYLMAALILLFLDSRRPGLDDMLGLPDVSIRSLKGLAPKLARWGIGGSMIFLAIYEKLLNPKLTAFVFDAAELTSVIPVSAGMWNLATGVIELAVGLLILLNIRTRLVAAIAFIVLALSFFYFKEDVASHITLFGMMTVVFVFGSRK